MINHREANEEDRKELGEWIASAPESHQISTDFWINKRDENGVFKEPGVKTVAIEDEGGKIFHLRIENVMRVYIQFPPEGTVNPERMRAALTGSFKTIAGNGIRLGYKEMIFDSVSKPLIRFFRRFGFKKLDDTFGVRL
jgi:hypothetical protein